MSPGTKIAGNARGSVGQLRFSCGSSTLPDSSSSPISWLSNLASGRLNAGSIQRRTGRRIGTTSPAGTVGMSDGSSLAESVAPVGSNAARFGPSIGTRGSRSTLRSQQVDSPGHTSTSEAAPNGSSRFLARVRRAQWRAPRNPAHCSGGGCEPGARSRAGSESERARTDRSRGKRGTS